MENRLNNQATSLRAGVLTPIDIKNCYKCGSVFIEDEFCESCGVQFSYNPLKKPFDESSYYTLKDNYIENLNIIYKLYPSTLKYEKSKRIGYLRKLLKRYKDLITMFGQTDTRSDNTRRFFFLEFEDLATELVRYKQQSQMKKILYTVLMDSSNDKMYHHLLSEINVISTKCNEKISLLSIIYNLEMAKGLRYRFVCVCVGIFSVLIILALSYYPRLLKVYQII